MELVGIANSGETERACVCGQFSVFGNRCFFYPPVVGAAERGKCENLTRRKPDSMPVMDVTSKSAAVTPLLSCHVW